ncbi:MAG TPA: tetratricopeptide repeat protein [Pyrinomonadaceae bacterium]|nr:tetratricopeptide repeat protein [Pyrinomonadaceae bacterium]
MRRQGISRSFFRLLMLAACAALSLGGAARAQEAGGDLGGGAGIFRPKNPETNRRRTGTGIKPPTVRKSAGPGGGRGGTRTPASLPPEVVEERFEDALEEGNQARDTRKYPEAEKSYREASQLKSKDWRGWYGLGNVYADQQRWDEAENAYKQASNYAQSQSDVFVALSYVLVQPRAGGANARKLSEAEQAARRAILIQSNHAVAHDRLGVALEERGMEGGDTEQAYRRAIELDPNFAVAYVHLARLLRKTGRKAEAEPLYARATELAQDAPTLVLIASALQSEQRWGESEKVLRRALELDANSPSALYHLGRALVVMKDFATAEQPLARAIEISPRSFAPYPVLGSAYLALGRYEDAEKIFTRALDVASAGERKGLAGAYGFEGVGDGYMKAGRKADAMRAYQRGLQLDPASASLQAKVKQ